MVLFSHNQKAYEAVMHAFQEGQKRVAIVHATGTGKSYVISAVAQNFSRVLVIAPNNYVLNETQKVCHAGCDFLTYAYLMNHARECNNYQLVVLDEFHRTGASKWGIGVQNIMTANPNALIFGTTATPVRSLDKGRNMADELFDGHIVSRLPMQDAIDQGILVDPVYVRSVFSFDEFESRIYNSKVKGLDKESLIKQLSVVRDNWKNAGGVSAIIRKHYNHNMKRVIVFSNSIKKVKPIKELLASWFCEAGFKNVKFYTIHSQMSNSDKQMAQFQEDEDGVLKVAITVNMLNEGVHIPRVDGIIMLRSSMSNIIVSQQIGRCMSAGNKDLRPVILDLVNNMDLILRYQGINEEEHSSESGCKKRKKTNHKEERSEEFPFKVIDECKEFRDVIQQVDEKLSFEHHTKEECIASARKYSSIWEWVKSKDGKYYYAARKNKWLDECRAHMEYKYTFHSKEECIAVAQKYSSRNKWAKSKDGKFYETARKNGWFNECCAHMKVNVRGHTKEMCLTSAQKYSTCKEWQRSKDSKYYYFARSHGWIKECCAHMEYKYTLHSKEECIAVARKYSSRREWANSVDNNYYNAARRYGWIKECCAHMETCKRKYSLDDCKKSAQKYSYRKEWRRSKDSRFFRAAERYGWLDECCKHMEYRKTVRRTKEECLISAKKYSSRGEWAKSEDKLFYRVAHLHGWLGECTAHMNKDKRRRKTS